VKKFNLQLFSTTGVHPVHNNVFKIGTVGRSSEANDLKQPKDLETFQLTVDGSVEDWTPMDTAGWVRRAVTGKGLSINFKGKRNYGDDGNDYIAGLLLKTGQDVETILEWTLPNGDKLTMNCIVDLKSTGGGDSTNIDALEFDVLSDGLPVYVSGSEVADLTFVCTDAVAAGATEITSVSPALTGGNSYMYKINGSIPDLDDVISAATGWTAYTINDDIIVANGNNIVLVEINGTNLAKKAGTAVSVVA